MAQIASKGIPLVIGTCPACGEVLTALVDLVPDGLSRPVVQENLVKPATTNSDPWQREDLEGRVDLSVRLTGITLRHVCGSRKDPDQ